MIVDIPLRCTSPLFADGIACVSRPSPQLTFQSDPMQFWTTRGTRYRTLRIKARAREIYRWNPAQTDLQILDVILDRVEALGHPRPPVDLNRDWDIYSAFMVWDHVMPHRVDSIIAELCTRMTSLFEPSAWRDLANAQNAYLFLERISIQNARGYRAVGYDTPLRMLNDPSYTLMDDDIFGITVQDRASTLRAPSSMLYALRMSLSCEEIPR